MGFPDKSVSDVDFIWPVNFNKARQQWDNVFFYMQNGSDLVIAAAIWYHVISYNSGLASSVKHNLYQNQNMFKNKEEKVSSECL